MITLYHDKQRSEKDKFKWHAYTEDLENIEGFGRLTYDGIIKVKFVDFNSINKDWLDGDYPDTMILENKNIELKIKIDCGELKLFVKFPKDAVCNFE